MDSRVVLLLRSVFPFTSRGGGGATPGLLLPLKRRRPRQPSPHHRVAHALSPVAYRRDLPTIGRWRASPVMAWDHFLQAAAGCTFMVRKRHSARPLSRRGFGSPSTLLPKGGAWRTMPAHVPSPGVSLPGPFDREPSPALPVARGWLLTSGEYAEFEQGVLDERGFAQVGFGVWLSSFHHLTLSSGGILSPEPLRLARPFRVIL